MAFTVQDDDGSIAGANAYLTVAEFKAYHADRGNDLSSYGDVDIQRAIVKATDYMDHRFQFVGYQANDDQRTMWPRVDAFDEDDHLVEGIPDRVKEACAEYAFVALASTLNPTPTRDATGRDVQAKSSTVGPISESVTYAAGASFASPKYPAADARLSGLVVAAGEIRRG